MAKSFLGANTDSIDAFLAGESSLFVGRDAYKSTNIFARYEDNAPLNTTEWGASLQFEPPQSADLLGKCFLVMNTAAAVSSGAGTNYPRFIDWIGYLCYDTVTVMFASNQLQRFSGLDCYITDLVRLRSEDSYSGPAGGGLSAATRNTNAESAYEFICPLSLLFWTSKPGNYLPYNIELLRRPITVYVKLKTLYEVMETDVAVTQVISSARLRCETIHLTKKEADALYAETQTKNESLLTQGWSRLVTTCEPLSDITLSGVTTAQDVKLTALRLPVKEILYTFRAPGDLASGTIDGTVVPSNFQAITSHKLQAFNENIHPTYTDNFNTIIMNEKHSGPMGSNVYISPFAILPESSDQFGYLNFATVSNPTLEVTLANSGHTNLHLTVPTHSVINLVGGDLRMLYA